MFDLVLTGGVVVDGTGRPSHRSDVGVLDGRIVHVGPTAEGAVRTVDVEGLVVAPGFIDVHTHYDAQAFWDATLSPSPLHGVTTVVGGNCGFSIAPVTYEDREYLAAMLARVEGMPLHALEAGVPWDWASTAEYLDRLDGTLAINAGFLVGHSALRVAVMHDSAVGGRATPEQITAMERLLQQGLAAGGLGFSSTWSITHNDHRGDPVPSRHGNEAELMALCAAVRRHPGTTLEFIPGVAPFDRDAFELMGKMSRAADRPLNWNVLQVYDANREIVDHQLAGNDIAAECGGRVVALTLPDSMRMFLNFRSGFVFDILPGWRSLMALPDAEKLAALADPSRRAAMNRSAQSAVGPTRSIANWARYRIHQTFAPANRSHTGRTVGEIAEEAGRSPWDVLVDIVVADGLDTVIANVDSGQARASWERRVEVWRHPTTLVGGSDAGAHLDMIDSFSYCTTLLAKAVRDHSLLSIEEAVELLTRAPAQLYGLKDRGELRPGAWADLLVLDPDAIEPEPISVRHDLPGGAGRLFGGAHGIHHVFVAGTEVVAQGEFTDARPGRVLRSGRDTQTVPARP